MASAPNRSGFRLHKTREFKRAIIDNSNHHTMERKVQVWGTFMGSTGTGSFSDYPGSRPKEGGNGAGGASGDDRCVRALSCALEEIEHCEFFTANGDVPPVGTGLSIEQRGRLVAVDGEGQIVGALPTRFNYLADCMIAGFSYAGRITASASTPVASVSADFAPSAP